MTRGPRVAKSLRFTHCCLWICVFIGSSLLGQAKAPVHRQASPSPHLKPGDAVEVLYKDEWTRTEIRAVDHDQYRIELPDGSTRWVNGGQLRKVQPPKPGLAVCSGKVAGKYDSASGFPSIVIQLGKASIQGDEAVECWVGGGKIYLHTPGSRADQDLVMEIKKDGSLDTPLGELRKKGDK
jgi:hypothetical protein